MSKEDTGVTYKATILVDSISPDGVRLTTLEVVFPRFILPEFNTHRMFSRNLASSRAIPLRRMMDKLSVAPIEWGSNRAGMTAGQSIENIEEAAAIWRRARIDAVYHAEELHDLGVHKQIVNRLLEPFATARGVVTATEWSNFFWLRLAADAQPEMQALARKMKNAMDDSLPKPLDFGAWHLPYITQADKERWPLDKLRDISAARCARVSYDPHDGGQRDGKRDLELADRLATSGHYSPFEHQATPIQSKEDATHMDSKGTLWSANLRGWIQYRQIL